MILIVAVGVMSEGMHCFLSAIAWLHLLLMATDASSRLSLGDGLGCCQR